MPASIKVFRLFVIGPSDIDDERQVVKDVIDDINKFSRTAYAAIFEYVGWDTDVLNTVGVDAQDVINNSIDDEYDAVVGFLWTRFGTPTGRAASGTKEEYERAMRRYEEGSLDHILWFIRVDPVVPSELDIAQYSSLRDFISDVREHALTLDYTLEKLERLLRTQLTTLLTALLEKGQVSTGDTSDGANKTGQSALDAIPRQSEHLISATNVHHTEDEEPHGILDMRIMLEEALQAYADSLIDLSSSMEIVNEAVTLASDKVKKVQILNGQLSAKEMMSLLDNPIEALNLYADESESKLPSMDQNLSDVINAFQSLRLMNVGEDDSVAEAELALEVDYLIGSMEEGKSGLIDLREALAISPPMSKKYNKARRRAVSALDKQISLFTNQQNMLRALIRGLTDNAPAPKTSPAPHP